MQYNSTAYFEMLKEIIIQFLSKNYDYCYLSAMHEKNRRDGAETMIVGSSHSMNGLLERQMEENGRLLSEMIGYLVQHEVQPIVLITPYTKHYNRYIDPAYREDINQLLESIPWPLEFFDMNDYADEFVDTDYMDSDHLSLVGAEKTTLLLNQYLQIIQEDAEKGAAEKDSDTI